MKPIDLIQDPWIIELNFAETYQAVGMLLDGVFDAVEVFGIDQQKCQAVDLVEFCQQPFEKYRVAVVMHVGIDQLGRRLCASQGAPHDKKR